MSIEEAIKQLKHELWCIPKEPPEDVDYNEEWLREHEKIIEAKELAIKILEKTIRRIKYENSKSKNSKNDK